MTDVLAIVLQVILAVTSLILILLILLHKGRGGGLSDMFGGGHLRRHGRLGVAERNLDRLTIAIGAGLGRGHRAARPARALRH